MRAGRSGMDAAVAGRPRPAALHGPARLVGLLLRTRPGDRVGGEQLRGSGLEQHDVDRELGVVYTRRAFANGMIKNSKTRPSTRAVPLQAKALSRSTACRPRSSDPVPERARQQDRLPRLRPPPLATRADRRRHRTHSRPLRPAPHLRHLRAPRRRSGVRRLALHRLEHRDDRSPRRPPGPARAASTQSRFSTRSRSNGRWTLRGRRTEAGKRAQQQRFEALSETD